MTVWCAIDAGSLRCRSLPNPPCLASAATYLSDSARTKLSTVTGSAALAGAVVAVCAWAAPSMAIAAPMTQVVVRIRFTGHPFRLVARAVNGLSQGPPGRPVLDRYQKRQPSAIKAVSRPRPLFETALNRSDCVRLSFDPITRDTCIITMRRKQSLSKEVDKHAHLRREMLARRPHDAKRGAGFRARGQHMNQPAIGEMLRDREVRQIGDTQPG